MGVLSAQFVPQISADSSVEVINFCRSPQWYLSRVSLKFRSHLVACAVERGVFFFQNQFDYPGWAKWAFAHVPFAMRAYRAFIMMKVSLGRSLFLCVLIGNLADRPRIPFFRPSRFAISALPTRSKFADRTERI